MKTDKEKAKVMMGALSWELHYRHIYGECDKEECAYCGDKVARRVDGVLIHDKHVENARKRYNSPEGIFKTDNSGEFEGPTEVSLIPVGPR